MSDDLIKRLRDRIEQLEWWRDKFEALALLGTHTRRDEATEAKLAKAVEALREIIDRWDTPSWKDAEATGSVINRARAVLAELEGEKK